MGWFEDLDRLIRERWKPGEEFDLEDAYRLSPELQPLHPDNSFVPEAIRKNLQDLRDAGKIEFVDNRGTYRVLNGNELTPSPKLSPSSREAILEALQQFDRVLRPTPEWADFTRNMNHDYAIEHEGLLYPVKQIVSMASGVPRTAFGGGREANRYVEGYGFVVKRLRDSNNTSPGPIRWWVNQGKTYKDERAGGYVWAPKQTRGGGTVSHHSNILSLKVGERILHYANGALRAVGTVVAPAVPAPRPAEANASQWDAEGLLAKVAYAELAEPFEIDNIPNEWRVTERGPFNGSGGVNQGYLFSLTEDFVTKLSGRIPELRSEGAAGKASSWIFQANPAKYDVVGAVRALPQLTWNINQYKSDIHMGDRVFLWAAGSDGGIVATATVLSEPSVTPELPGEGAFWRSEDPIRGGDKLRVTLGINAALPAVVAKNELASHPELRKLGILTFPNATNFRVSVSEAALLEELIGKRLGKPRSDAHYWAIAPGEGARLWSAFLEEGIVAIGWEDLGDLRQYNSKEAIASALKSSKQTEDEPKNDALACYQFVHTMRIGDVVFAKRGTGEVVGYGVLEGEYEYRADRTEYPHVRRVQWLATGVWELPDNAQLPIKTLTNVSDYAAFLAFILPRVATTPAVAATIEDVEQPEFSIEEALTGLFLESAAFRKILDTMARKRNVVLQGPPGVGKTFIAKRIAYALIGRKDEGRVQMIQFHQSYAYEDFVQGWRPSQDGFELKDGVFYSFCKRAAADKSARPYVFIIDEINRANLSKVLGEMMLLIESDKRGEKYAIPLTYSRDDRDRFSVPENLYILGLMNTADRSLAMVDYALRRRFAFFRLEPAFDSPKFRVYLTEKGASSAIIDLIISRLTKLNEQIVADQKHLGSGFEVGHSFFCPQGTEERLDEAWYREVVDSEVAPLLREYWFDNGAKAEEWIQGLEP